MDQQQIIAAAIEVAHLIGEEHSEAAAAIVAFLDSAEEIEPAGTQALLWRSEAVRRQHGHRRLSSAYAYEALHSALIIKISSNVAAYELCLATTTAKLSGVFPPAGAHEACLDNVVVARACRAGEIAIIDAVGSDLAIRHIYERAYEAEKAAADAATRGIRIIK